MSDEPFAGHGSLVEEPKGVPDKVDRKYLFEPKDEEPPRKPGDNYYDQFPRMPPVTRVTVQIEVREMAQHIDPMVQNHDIESVLAAWKKAKINVKQIPGTTIVHVQIVPK